MTARIVIDPQRIRFRGRGPSTGEIWFTFDGEAFPAPNWNDFVVAIMEAWMAALLRIVRGSSTFERVHFMDGPFQIEIRCAGDRELQLRAVERPYLDDVRVREKARANVDIGVFMGDLSRAAGEVIAAARAVGDTSADLVRLAQALPEVRREVIRVTNRSK